MTEFVSVIYNRQSARIDLWVPIIIVSSADYLSLGLKLNESKFRRTLGLKCVQFSIQMICLDEIVFRALMFKLAESSMHGTTVSS